MITNIIGIVFLVVFIALAVLDRAHRRREAIEWRKRRDEIDGWYHE
jgi:preprotein translocase subunit SecG